MKTAVWPLLFIFLVSLQAKGKTRKFSSTKSCRPILQGVVTGYEVDDYGRNEKIETVDEMTKDWTGSEFEFSVIPMKMYRKLSLKGKQNLELELEILTHEGKLTFNKSYSRWERWPARTKEGEASYMRLQGFSLRRIFSHYVHPPYEKFNKVRSSQGKKKSKKSNLPQKINIKVINKAKKKVLCEHVIELSSEGH